MSDVTDRDPIQTPHAVLDHNEHGLPRLRICGPHGAADVYLHGATVTSFTPAGGEPVLFLSEQAALDGSKAIRGGVPICFPWFGPKHAPSHGFARTAAWTLVAVRDDGDQVHAQLKLTDADDLDPEARRRG